MKQTIGSLALRIALIVAYAIAPINALAITKEIADNITSAPIEEPLTPKPSIKDVLLEICGNRGYGEDCAQILLGMMWKESRIRGSAIGDSGNARGYYQIHYKLHNISIECAEDLRCSSEWALDYLERNSYPKYEKYAVQCHNLCDGKNGYASAVLRHGKYLWNTDGAFVDELL